MNKNSSSKRENYKVSALWHGKSNLVIKDVNKRNIQFAMYTQDVFIVGIQVCLAFHQ